MFGARRPSAAARCTKGQPALIDPEDRGESADGVDVRSGGRALPTVDLLARNSKAHPEVSRGQAAIEAGLFEPGAVPCAGLFVHAGGPYHEER